jgi:hypothetical protein
VVIEDFARDGEQAGHQRVAERVSDGGADLAGNDDVAAADTARLRHDRLPEIERLLQFLDAAVAAGERLRTEWDGMRSARKKSALECLQRRPLMEMEFYIMYRNIPISVSSLPIDGLSAARTGDSDDRGAFGTSWIIDRGDRCLEPLHLVSRRFSFPRAAVGTLH